MRPTRITGSRSASPSRPGGTVALVGRAPRHGDFPPDVITLAVRWYLNSGLFYRDVEELLAERDVEVDNVTVYRWVQRLFPSSPRPREPGGTPRGSLARR